MKTSTEKSVEACVNALIQALGEELYSCCQYGSTVRGNPASPSSDVNILLVINHFTASVHEAIAEVMGANPAINPFILERNGLERTVRCFAAKFSSIKRHYRILHGADPLASIYIDPSVEKLLCEQAIRNLMLRLTYAFATRRRRSGSYGRSLGRFATPLFVHLAEVLRLEGKEVPQDFPARAAALAGFFGFNERVMLQLLSLKQHPRRLSDKEESLWHQELLVCLSAATEWIDEHWTRG